MPVSITDILFPILIFQLLFVSLFLFTLEKGKRIGHFLLGFFFLAIALNLADSFLILRGIYDQYPNWALWGSQMILLYGPLIYFYTRSLVLRQFIFKPVYLIHFIPFLLVFVLSITGYQMLPASEKIRILDAVKNRQLPAFVYVISILLYAHFLIYVLAAFRLIGRYRKVLVENYSDHYLKNLSWLKYLLLFFMIFLGLGLLNGFISLTSLSRFYYFFLFILIAVLFVFINQVLFKALRNPALFAGVPEEEIEMLSRGAPKYAGSNLSDFEKEAIRVKLVTIMSEKKPYLDADLTLEQLAASVGTKPKLLSQVINERLGQNFFDFVNGYRIEEAKRLLTRPRDKKITVLEVMYEVGFNSKSSFNTLFKKQTGVTPSEFKKANLD